MRNHETDWSSGPMPLPDLSYDPLAPGRVTYTQLDSNNNVLKEGWALTGTLRNCAGAKTPWNSWLSCEETFLGPNNGPLEKSHGHFFEVPATIGPLKKINPIEEMGRFINEAAIVNPKSGYVYLTEYRENGCFYRFIPRVKGQLHRGGTLYALQIGNIRKL